MSQINSKRRALFFQTIIVTLTAAAAAARADVEFVNPSMAVEFANPAHTHDYLQYLKEKRDECVKDKSLRVYRDMSLGHDGSNRSFDYYYRYSRPNPGGMTFVFLPGGPGGSYDDSPIPEKFNVLAFDSRGAHCNFGNRARFTPELLATSLAVQDIATVIESLRLKNYIVIGESYGTVTGTMLVSLLQQKGIELPAALVLAGTVGHVFPHDYWERAVNLPLRKIYREHPQVAALFRSNSNLPLGLKSEAWARLLYDLENEWPNELPALLELTKPQPSAEALAYFKKRSIVHPATYVREDDMNFYLTSEVACAELVRTYPSYSTRLDFHDGLIRFVPLPAYPSGNTCDGHALSRPYDSARDQVEVPIIYFQGDIDQETPAEFAKYHYAHQLKAKFKEYIEVRDGPHGVLESPILRPCMAEIWEHLARARFDFSDLLDEQGHCR